LLAAIRGFFVGPGNPGAGRSEPIIKMDQPQNEASDAADARGLRDRIERALNDRVRPDLESDGGGIELVGIDPDRIVQVRLTGACQGCSSSLITLTMRVESILKAAVPEIRFVEAVP
jgi:Fe-S cluster biogenesis protein NfuA